MHMKRIFIFLVLCMGIIIQGKAQSGELMLPSEMPREQIIHHEAFSMSYNSSYVLPSWVAYKITKSQVNKEEKIKIKYKTDPLIKSKAADKKDYKGSGYLSAQLVNYLDVKSSKKAVNESFYLSNIVPMKLAFYNHIWLKLEDMTRAWCAESEEIYIITGPILTDAPFPTFGESKISLPTRYYKVLYDPSNERAVAFIFRNGMSSGTIKSFAVTIDEIEKETGIDMFPELDDETENDIEGQLMLGLWDWEVLE